MSRVCGRKKIRMNLHVEPRAHPSCYKEPHEACFERVLRRDDVGLQAASYFDGVPHAHQSRGGIGRIQRHAFVNLFFFESGTAHHENVGMRECFGIGEDTSTNGRIFTKHRCFSPYDEKPGCAIMRPMRSFVFRCLYYSGLVALVRFFHRNSLTIILYHGVAPRQDFGIYNYRKKFIEPAHFERQLRYLKKRYCVLPLDEAVERLNGGTLPRCALAITFDDGYENNYMYAFPLLKRMGLQATFFITTDFVFERKPLWVDRLEYASGARNGTRMEREQADAKMRDALKHMPEQEKNQRLEVFERAARSLVDFEGERSVYAPLTEAHMHEMETGGIRMGAHTKTHPILSRLSETEMRAEIVGSKLTLQQHGFDTSAVFAYPNGQPGDWTDATERNATESGFSAALTTVEGVNTRKTPPMRLRRMTMDGTSDDLAQFASIVSGVRLYISQLKHLMLWKKH